MVVAGFRGLPVTTHGRIELSASVRGRRDSRMDASSVAYGSIDIDPRIDELHDSTAVSAAPVEKR